MTAVVIDDHAMLLGPDLWTLIHGQPEELPNALRCAYASKRCDNPRTIKKSGGPHRFCTFHRERANRNQWRVDHRRRMLKNRKVVEETPSSQGSPRCFVDRKDQEQAPVTALARRAARQRDAEELAGLADDYEVCSLREAHMSEQDVAILTELLFDDCTELTTPHTANVDAVIAASSDGDSDTSFVFALPWEPHTDLTTDPSFEPLFAVVV